MTAPAARLRPVEDADREFLYRVYASTRAEELAVVPWSDDEKEAFLRMQFDAQDVHYRGHYGGADFLVVEVAGEAIGRVYLYRQPHELVVMDIALLPQWRGRGIGTSLMREVLAEAGAGGAAVSLHVEENNPARRLYARLGFVEVEKGPVYDRLEWTSTSPAED